MKKILNTNTSYSFLNATEFLQTYLINYIKEINKEVGISPNPTMFGKYIKVSDDDIPSKKFIVISFRKRNEDFEEIDLEDNLLDIILEILDINNDEFKKYVKKNVFNVKKKNTQEVAFYYTQALSHHCLNGEHFDSNKADYIVDNYKYQGKHTAWERMNSLVDFITAPNEENLFELIKNYSEDISMLSGYMRKLLDGEHYQYHSEIVTQAGFVKNMLEITLALLDTDTMDDFILYMIQKIINKG